jgi:hypothetical protein
MRFTQLIEIADAAYPDGMIAQAEEAYQNKCAGTRGRRATSSVGDGLAEFIVNELHDTWDPRSGTANQLAEAERVMNNATSEVGAVANAFAKVAR